VKSHNGKLIGERTEQYQSKENNFRKRSRSNISPRRTTSDQMENDTEERQNNNRTVKFKDTGTEESEIEYRNYPQDNKHQRLIQRRGALRFITVDEE